MSTPQKRSRKRGRSFLTERLHALTRPMKRESIKFKIVNSSKNQFGTVLSAEAAGKMLRRALAGKNIDRPEILLDALGVRHEEHESYLRHQGM